MTLVIYKSPRRLLYLVLIIFCIMTVIMLLIYNKDTTNLFSNQAQQLGFPPSEQTWQPRPSKSIPLSEAESREFGGKTRFQYDKDMPLIFIGGMPRSGTTLVRVMMDSHPDVRCGGETRVIPRLLNLRNTWVKSPLESNRLNQAGITPEVLDTAVGEFIIEIIARHGPPAKRLCNKDPFTLKSAVYIRSIFPRAQFLYVIRDGRAVAHSIVSRQVTISGFNITDYRQILEKWNSASSSMYDQCKSLGKKICHPVYYEQLVLHPEQTMRSILSFLDLPWNQSVLHHERFVDKPNGAELSNFERSTDQVVKPVNTDQLSKWVGAIPQDVIADMANIAPMLKVLGYDPNANPPNYGDPDPFVLGKMKLIEDNKEDWQELEERFIKRRDEARKAALEQSNKDKRSLR